MYLNWLRINYQLAITFGFTHDIHISDDIFVAIILINIKNKKERNCHVTFTSIFFVTLALQGQFLLTAVNKSEQNCG